MDRARDASQVACYSTDEAREPEKGSVRLGGEGQRQGETKAALFKPRSEISETAAVILGEYTRAPLETIRLLASQSRESSLGGPGEKASESKVRVESSLYTAPWGPTSAQHSETDVYAFSGLASSRVCTEADSARAIRRQLTGTSESLTRFGAAEEPLRPARGIAS